LPNRKADFQKGYKPMAHKPSNTDWAAWFLMAMAAVLAGVILGSQIGNWLGYAIGAGMH
jgi:hypothetical protein